MLFRSALAGSAVDPRPSATTSATAPRMYRRLVLMGKARVGAPPYGFARDLAKIGHSPATKHQGSGTSVVTQASRSHAVRREPRLSTEDDRGLAQILLPQQRFEPDVKRLILHGQLVDGRIVARVMVDGPAGSSQHQVAGAPR